MMETENDSIENAEHLSRIERGNDDYREGYLAGFTAGTEGVMDRCRFLLARSAALADLTHHLDSVRAANAQFFPGIDHTPGHSEGDGDDDRSGTITDRTSQAASRPPESIVPRTAKEELEELKAAFPGTGVRRIAYLASQLVITGQIRDHAAALTCRDELARQVALGEDADPLDDPEVSAPNTALADKMLGLSPVAWLTFIGHVENAAIERLKRRG